MADLWTSAISSGMSTFQSLFGDFLPIIALAIGLAVLVVVVGIFTGRNNG